MRFPAASIKREGIKAVRKREQRAYLVGLERRFGRSSPISDLADARRCPARRCSSQSRRRARSRRARRDGARSGGCRASRRSSGPRSAAPQPVLMSWSISVPFILASSDKLLRNAEQRVIERRLGRRRGQPIAVDDRDLCIGCLGHVVGHRMHERRRVGALNEIPAARHSSRNRTCGTTAPCRRRRAASASPAPPPTRESSSACSAPGHKPPFRPACAQEL